MFIIRKKDGEIIAIASREEDAIGMADAARVDKTDYVVQESTDSVELREIYRSYYRTIIHRAPARPMDHITERDLNDR